MNLISGTYNIYVPISDIPCCHCHGFNLVPEIDLFFYIVRCISCGEIHYQVIDLMESTH